VKVFLSWSGERSRIMAAALRDWLPLVLYYVRPWVSGKDIQAGERWSLEVGKKLEESNFGILCLTKDNLNAPWMLFEAGALSKAISTAAVCPYILDAEFREIGVRRSNSCRR
jgi:TIR domain